MDVIIPLAIFLVLILIVVWLVLTYVVFPELARRELAAQAAEERRLKNQEREKRQEKIDAEWEFAKQLFEDLEHVDHGSPEEQLVLKKLDSDEYSSYSPDMWLRLSYTYKPSYKDRWKDRPNVEAFLRRKKAEAVRKRATE